MLTLKYFVHKKSFWITDTLQDNTWLEKNVQWTCKMLSANNMVTTSWRFGWWLTLHKDGGDMVKVGTWLKTVVLCLIPVCGEDLSFLVIHSYKVEWLI